MLPLSGQTNDWVFGVEGWVPPAAGIDPSEQARVVHGQYFELMEIPLKAGRLFTELDTAQRGVTRRNDRGPRASLPPVSSVTLRYAPFVATPATRAGR